MISVVSTTFLNGLVCLVIIAGTYASRLSFVFTRILGSIFLYVYTYVCCIRRSVVFNPSSVPRHVKRVCMTANRNFCVCVIKMKNTKGEQEEQRRFGRGTKTMFNFSRTCGFERDDV